VPVERLFGDLPEGCGHRDARIGEHDVQVPLLLFQGGEQAIQIGEVRDVSLDARDEVIADLLHRGIELALASPGDEHIRTIGNKLSGRGEADPAVASVINATFPSSFFIATDCLVGTTARLSCLYARLFRARIHLACSSVSVWLSATTDDATLG
jgi:hypothetical protein